MAKRRPIYVVSQSLGYYTRRRFAGGAQRLNKNGRPAKHRADAADLVHLQAPQTSENEGANVFCPVETEFTRIFMGRSADGLETYACAACYEPEPRIADVTDEELTAIYRQLYGNT